MRKLWRRPSPAMIVALIALFVALSGIGYAAATIGTNDIKNGAVTARKLHSNAVRAAKIKNGAVTKDKLAQDVLGSQRFVETLNGVQNRSGCPPEDLAVRITDGRGVSVDDRFTFQVPRSTAKRGEAFGQIKPDGSIRNSSPDAPNDPVGDTSTSMRIAGVTHQPGTGTYCIEFSKNPRQDALESAVVSMHFN